MYTLDDEILLEGAPPDDMRQISPSLLPQPRRRMKFVRDAMSVVPVKVHSRVNPGGVWWRAALVDLLDTDLVASACIEEHRGTGTIHRNRRWHEVVLDGNLTTENLTTGGAYHVVKGDRVYWGPVYIKVWKVIFVFVLMKILEPEINAYDLDGSSRDPGTPPDERVSELMHEA